MSEIKKVKKGCFKYCIVPKCSSSTKTSEKVFFSVPMEKDRRKKWCNLMGKDLIGPKSMKYVCEDHFDIETDTANLVKYKLVGGTLKLKSEAYPHKFNCQNKVVKPLGEREAHEKTLKHLLNNDDPSTSSCQPFELIERDRDSIPTLNELNVAEDPLPDDWIFDIPSDDRENIMEDLQDIAMLDFEEEALLLLAILEEDDQFKRKRKKRTWIHDTNAKRAKYGEFHIMTPQLRDDPEKFFTYFNMPQECFYEILSLIEDQIRKKYTSLRAPISPEERTSIALRFLSTGGSFATMARTFRVGTSTVASIVRECCYAICQKLGPIYMPEPTSKVWAKAAAGFQQKYNIPNCCGAIEGRYVAIQNPPKGGYNYYYNLKKNSIVILAVIDSDNKFICVDIGDYGKDGFGGILEKSEMGKRMEKGTMNMPQPKKLPGQSGATPYVVAGNEAFSLKPCLMRPIPPRLIKGVAEKELYNSRLAECRAAVDPTFDLLTKNWQLFKRPLEVNLSNAKVMIVATCILHNYLIDKKVTVDASTVDQTPPQDSAFRKFEIDNKRATNKAFKVRENFIKFFNSEVK